MDNKYKPKFTEGNLVCRKPLVVYSFGGVYKTAIENIRPWRVVSVNEDKRAEDCEGEPGYRHIYICDPVIHTARCSVSFYQNEICLWYDIKDEVIASIESLVDAFKNM